MSRVITDNLIGILTVWQEARGESDRGQQAVAEVIIRRTSLHFRSDGSVASTVLWPYQFSGWNTRDPNRIAAVKLDDGDASFLKCRGAWNVVMSQFPQIEVVPGALFYFNPVIADPKPDTSEWELVEEIGKHQFWKPKGPVE